MTTPLMIHVVDDDEPVRTSDAFALQVARFRAVTYVDAETSWRADLIGALGKASAKPRCAISNQLVRTP